ncbi:uncharacterized protein PHACADRAFT_165407 [Phanerochaete carnosa HHB-10118-sp]|uniref:HIG1 domain-containing protein n=1 Tax=Phanerochaete carnosa (strain HHB-10118-sp) TaxID=650164 RepID=K5VZM7_PHACS|nr:uncharacterized protein PHACADRAFT_165407 [Phanerochaete carnosa HHB-10118-sp]EKM52074.1 hypothetical protein PHACADRAFT_165407 [Phanerochaete carnosa HHB-10118-sp]
MRRSQMQESDAQYNATVRGGLKGLVGGTAVAGAGSYYLQRTAPYYRQLPPSLKAFGVIVVAVPAFVISAEHAGLQYEREQWTGAGKEELDKQEARAHKRWERLSVTQKAQDLAARYQYGLVIGGWAAALFGSFYFIKKNPYQTLPQKIVQARLVAQGTTLTMLLGAGYLAHERRKRLEGPLANQSDPHSDHSWKDIIEGSRAAH